MKATRIIHSKPGTIISTIIIVFLVILLSIVQSVNIWYVITLCFWISMFMFSTLTIKKSPLFFCFLVAFFVFLLGRQFCYYYLHIDQVYEFLNVVNDYTYICLAVSLIGLMLGIYLSGRVNIKLSYKKTILISGTIENSREYQRACKYIFFLCYIGTIIATLLQIRFVRRVGYVTSYSTEAGGAGIPTILSYLSRFTPIAICLFLGTKPSKKEIVLPLILYEAYAIMSLMTGQRYPFIGISMLIFIYFLLRNQYERGWVKKYYYLVLVIGVPVLMFFSVAYDSIRQGTVFSFDNYLGTLINFFVQQGGSINVIRRTIYNSKELIDLHLVSFQSIYSSLFENGVSRRVFGITTYSGNSLERAMNSNSLAHRLSYIAYGNGYLMGRGTGSCFIAELLHDFSIIGVIIGSVIYGFIIKKIDRMDFNHPVGDGFRLAMIYYLILAPRGGFDSFIGNVFTLQSVMGFLLILFLTLVIKLGKGKVRA